MKLNEKLSLNVLLLGVVSFLNDLSSEMIAPILPMFIASLGGAGIATGLIGGLRDSITSLLKVVSGYISDKTGKRIILVFSGYLTSSIFKMLLAFSRVWQHVLLFIGLERIGKGMRDAPRDAIIALSMPKQKGRAFGIHRAFDATGAVVGSLLALLFFYFLKFDYKTIIVLSSLVAFTSLFPIKFVKEKKKKENDIQLRATLNGLSKKLKLFLSIAGVFAISKFSYMFFVLRAQQLFATEYTIAMPILLYVLFNVFYAGSSAPFGALSDRIGRRKVVLMGYLLFAITALGFAVLTSLYAYIILFSLYGIMNGIIDGNQRAFVSDLSSHEIQGTSLGAYHTTIGLATLPASIIAGALWQIAPEVTFFYGAAVSTLAAVLLLATWKKYD